MRAWIKMLASIGLIAGCALDAGCGGGNAPRAITDSEATRDSPLEPPTPPPAPEAAKPAPEPVASDVDPPQPVPAVAVKEDKEDESGEEKPAPAGQNKPASKPDVGSSTTEVLAIATNNPPASNIDAAPGQNWPVPANPEPLGGAAPAGTLGTPSQEQREPPGYPGMGNPGGMPAGYPGAASPDAMPAGYPGFPGPGGVTTGYPRMPGRSVVTQGAAGGGAPGAAVASRSANGASSNFGSTDARSPEGVVQSFLFALLARDKEQLREATAKRSQFEASSEQQKELFRKIVDPEENLSDAELEDIARKLEGYVIAGENAVHTTGKLGIIIMRLNRDGSYLTRTVTVRKEKKGWGVMDVSSPTQFTATGGMRHKHPGGGER